MSNVSNVNFKSTYEATQAWVSRTHSEGFSKGLSFKDDTLYSGDVIIAKLIGSAVVFSTTSYGMGATKNRLAAEAASREYKQVFVPFCELSLAENITEAKAQIRALLLKAATATVKRQEETDAAIAIAQGINQFAILLGDTTSGIPMEQFENIDYDALKFDSRTVKPRRRNSVAKAGKKASYRASPPDVDNIITKTPRIESKGDSLTITSAFGLLNGIHNMGSMGINIQDGVNVDLHMPMTILPDGGIKIGGRMVKYEEIQKIRAILGVQHS